MQRRNVAGLIMSCCVLLSARALAQSTEPPVPEATAPAMTNSLLGRPAFEVNVLWPFFPGGLSDLKVLVPVLRPKEKTWRGELVLGLNSDFATLIVRPDADYGKVSFLGAKVGYRQFFVAGLHLEVNVTIGWRHEVRNVYDGTTIDGLSARAWVLAGYQHDLNDRVYVNVRGGIAPHLFRTGPFAEKERKLTGGGDINLGFRF